MEELGQYDQNILYEILKKFLKEKERTLGVPVSIASKWLTVSIAVCVLQVPGILSEILSLLNVII